MHYHSCALFYSRVLIFFSSRRGCIYSASFYFTFDPCPLLYSLSLYPFLSFLFQSSLSTSKNAIIDKEGTMKFGLITTTILLPLVLSAPLRAPQDDHPQVDDPAARLYAYAEARGVDDSTSVISLKDAYVVTLLLSSL